MKKRGKRFIALLTMVAIVLSTWSSDLMTLNVMANEEDTIVEEIVEDESAPADPASEEDSNVEEIIEDNSGNDGSAEGTIGDGSGVIVVDPVSETVSEDANAEITGIGDANIYILAKGETIPYEKNVIKYSWESVNPSIGPFAEGKAVGTAKITNYVTTNYKSFVGDKTGNWGHSLKSQVTNVAFTMKAITYTDNEGKKFTAALDNKKVTWYVAKNLNGEWRLEGKIDDKEWKEAKKPTAADMYLLKPDQLQSKHPEKTGTDTTGYPEGDFIGVGTGTFDTSITDGGIKTYANSDIKSKIVSSTAKKISDSAADTKRYTVGTDGLITYTKDDGSKWTTNFADVNWYVIKDQSGWHIDGSATWTEVEEIYTVSFDMVDCTIDGKKNFEVKVKKNKDTDTFTVVADQGYKFNQDCEKKGEADVEFGILWNANNVTVKGVKSDCVITLKADKDESQKKTLKYYVNYYKDGELKDTDTESKKVWAGTSSNEIETKSIDKNKYSKDGYQFKEMKISGTVITDLPTKVQDQTTIDVYYTNDARFTVTFDAKNGTAVTSTKYKYNETVKVPQNPKKTDPNGTIEYTFDYWKAADGTKYGTGYAKFPPVTKDAVYTAQYKEATIKHHLEITTKHGYIRNNDEVDLWVPHGHTTQAFTLKAKQGYMFDGTYENKKPGTTPNVVFGDDNKTVQIVNMTSDVKIKLTAVKTKEISYTVKYFKGNIVTPEKVWTEKKTVPESYKGEIAVDPSVLNRDEYAPMYVFQSIKLNKSNTSSYDLPATVENGTIINVYFVNLERFNVVFHKANGDSDEIIYNHYKYNATVVVPANPTKTDPTGKIVYTFKGWEATDGTMYGTNYAAFPLVTSDAYYTAIYSPETVKHDVTITTVNGTVSGQPHVKTSVEHAETTPEYVLKADLGYKFDGTYAPDGSASVVFGTDNKSVKVTNVVKNVDITLTAVKDDAALKKLSYTVKYYKDGVPVANATETVSEDRWVGNTSDDLKVISTISPNKYAPEYLLKEIKQDGNVITAFPANATSGTVFEVYYVNEARFTVSFNDFDNSLIEKNTYKYGEAVQTVSDPSKVDPTGKIIYTFDGWKGEDGKMYGKTYPAIPSVTKDTVYTAAYTEKEVEHTVSINAVNGTVGGMKSIPAFKVKHLEGTSDYTLEANPGYMFTDKDYKLNGTADLDYSPSANKVSLSNIKTDVTLTLTAVENQKDTKELSYTVKYYKDGNIVDADTETVSENVWKGISSNDMKVTSTISPNKYVPEYLLKEIKQDGNVITAFPANATSGTVFEVYYVNEARFTVSFNDFDNSLIEKNTYKYGEAVQTVSDPSKVDPTGKIIYTFDGWKGEDGKMYGKTYSAIPSVTKDTVYTAVYTEKVVTHTVSINVVNGTVSGQDHVELTVNHADGTPVYTLAAKKGYKFDGSYDLNGAASMNYSASANEVSFTNVTSDIVLTIIAVKDNDAKKTLSYTLNFYLDGVLNKSKKVTKDYWAGADSSEIDVEDVVSGNEFAPEYEFEKIDYTSSIASLLPGSVKDGTEINVYYVNKARFTVSFIDFDSKQLGSDLYKYGEAVKVVANPTRIDPEGKLTYTFDGWKGADGKMYGAKYIDIPKVTGNTVYQAVYNSEDVLAPTKQYTVSFIDYDGKEIVAPQKLDDGAKVTVPADPTRKNYKFRYWKNVATGVTYAPADIPVLTEDTTYQAVYKKKSVDSKDDDDENDEDSGSGSSGSGSSGSGTTGNVATGVLGAQAAPTSGVLGAQAAPNTGDNYNSALWLAMMFLSLGAIGFLFKKEVSKKKNK